MKIATWNVNSVRARMVNVLNFIEEHKPSVLLLQELKCTNEQFPYFELESLGYQAEVAGQKGRNGVAILSQFPLENTKKPDMDGARYIEACFCYEGKYIKVASVYVPNGSPTVNEQQDDILHTQSFARKMDFCDELCTQFADSVKQNETAFFCGDYNVCPNLQIDVWTPEKDGTITNTEEERAKFQAYLNAGMRDVWRDFNPSLQDYTWWGYRPYTMWQNNQGYRLDAILASTATARLVKSCNICREERGKEHASDHVPMVVEI